MYPDFGSPEMKDFLTVVSLLIFFAGVFSLMFGDRKRDKDDDSTGGLV